MPPQTIHAKIYSRTLGLAGPGPIFTCLKVIGVERRDAAGEFRAEFPASDPMLLRVTLKQTYLAFEIGGKFFCAGLVERIWTETDDKGQQITVITGRDQLGALAENTVGDLTLEYSFDAPEQIISAADVPNQNFSLSADGYAVTAYPYTKQFAGESALSALTKLAADIGEHFRAPKAMLLEVVWMGTATPDAPVRLVSAGGPRLHENDAVAIISHIERDENGEQMANRIYPYGAGIGAARLTLAAATLTMPTGYSMSTGSNYIQNDDQQSLPSVRKSIQKVWNHIGVDIGLTYTIQVATTALTGATVIIVESIALPLPTGALLDLNGGGTNFVELSANVSIGANVLNVVATTFDVLDTDSLVYTPADAETAAANTLAYAALTYLQRISEPSRMVAYKLTVRGLPDTVTVGMKIPVLSQAPGFPIDDDLIILEITRTVTRNGQMPAVLKVVPTDWFDVGEAGSIAATMEDFRVSQAQAQPVSYATIPDAPTVYTQEEIEDFVAAMLAGNTGIIDAVYDDGAGTIALTLDVSVADRLLYSTGADAWAETPITAFGRSLLDDAAASNALTTLGLVIGTDVQAYDAELAALAGVVSAANKLFYFTGSGTGAVTDFSAFGRTLVDDADAATGRATLGITVYDQETAEDIVGAMVSGNTETGISVTYDDGTGKLNFVVSAQDHGGLSGLGDDDHTQYVLLAGRSGGQRVTGIASTGYALEVYRNLSSGSTNSAVMAVTQDHATDDQDTLRLQQDGTGKVIAAYDDGTEVFSLISAGSHTILALDAIATKASFFSFKANGGLYQTTMGLVGAANQVFSGSAAGDFAVRAADNQKLLLGVDNGAGSNSPAIYVLESGVIGFGVASPQGRLHSFDGTAGFLAVSKTGINGTAQTIIPNGTGDVVSGCYIIGRYTNTVPQAGALGIIVENSSNYDFTNAGNTLRFAVAADGTLTVQRTAGSATWEIAVIVIWK